MSNYIQWYLESRIIYNCLEGDISVKSIVNASKIMLEMAMQAGEPVTIIIDASRLTKAPTQIGDLTSATKNLLDSPLVNHMIIVTDNPIQRFTGNIVLQVFRKSSKIVPNLEEALATLKKLNPSLSDLPSAVPNTEIITVKE